MGDERMMASVMMPGFDALDAMESFLEAMRRPAWHSRAVCRGMGTKLWLTGKPNTTAEGICATCPVARQCLASALEHEDVGTWGGTHTATRAAIRRATAA